LQRAADLRRRAAEVHDYSVQRDLLYIAKQYELHAHAIIDGAPKIGGNRTDQ
jgi:hypothetical protein